MSKRSIVTPEADKIRVTFQTFDEMLPLSKLKKSRFQRNKHPKDQIERLAKLMKMQGVRHPIHISKLSGEVCFGHGRWEAATLNKWAEYPVVYQDFIDEQEEYNCVQSDNAIAGWSELDLSSINTDLKGMKGLDLDLLGIRSFSLEPLVEPSPKEDQGQLDEKAKETHLITITCPHCGESFERGTKTQN